MGATLGCRRRLYRERNLVSAMGKFSDADRERIMQESRATLERGQAEHEQPLSPAPVRDDLAEALARPLDDRVERWRAEQDEIEQRRERARADREQTTLENRLAALIDQRVAALRSEIAAEIAGVRTDLLGVATAASHAVKAVGDALDDLASVARAPAKAANEHVEAMLKRVEAKLDELNPRRRAGEVVDLPALPLRSRAN
jgi:chromosome segregation ATPase